MTTKASVPQVEQDNQPSKSATAGKVTGLAALAGAAAMAAAPAANAAIDASAVTSLIGDGVTAAALVGVAWLGYHAGIAIYKKLRSAV